VHCLLDRAEGRALAAVQDVLRAGAQLVVAGFVTEAIPATGTGNSVSAPAGSGSFGSRSRATTRIELWAGRIVTVSVVSYSTRPSAVATRIPPGIVISPSVLAARTNSTSPEGRPPRTR
jgi:hypothetical protein